MLLALRRIESRFGLRTGALLAMSIIEFHKRPKLRTVSLLFVFSMAISAQNVWSAPVKDSDSNTCMTIYPVESEVNGKQFFTTNDRILVPLPGAGVSGPDVCIYSSPGGHQWYVDRKGEKRLLAPLQGFASKSIQSASTSSQTAGAAVSRMSASSIPYGKTVYWGGGSPWYSETGGNTVYIKKDSYRGYDEWSRQNNYWQKNSKSSAFFNSQKRDSRNDSVDSLNNRSDRESGALSANDRLSGNRNSEPANKREERSDPRPDAENKRREREPERERTGERREREPERGRTGEHREREPEHHRERRKEEHKHEHHDEKHRR